jgi:hypothetical protein
MKLQVRYIMPGWYGNFTTYPVVVGTDLDEVSVFTLKLKI